MIVDLFIPCLIDQFYPETGFNMVKVLERVGCTVNYNPSQTCCGQPAWSAGSKEDCRALGEKFVSEFQNDRYIVSPSPACSSFVRTGYNELFTNSALHNDCRMVQKNLFEFADFLVNVLKITRISATLNAKAVLMSTCYGTRHYGTTHEGRILLEKVKGLKLMRYEGEEVCCGFGGNFSLKFPQISTSMAEAKVDAILASGAELIIAQEYACLMHLEGYIKRNNIPLRVMHLADVLAEGWD